MELVAAIDLGGTAIKAALVDAGLNSVHTVRVPTRRTNGVVDVDQLGELVGTLSRHAAGLGRAVAGLGVVAPGIVDGELGIVRFTANLGWHDVPLRERLAEHTRLPLRIGHDVRTGGLAEFTVGAAVGVRNAMFNALVTMVSAGSPVPVLRSARMARALATSVVVVPPFRPSTARRSTSAAAARPIRSFAEACRAVL